MRGPLPSAGWDHARGGGPERTIGLLTPWPGEGPGRWELIGAEADFPHSKAVLCCWLVFRQNKGFPEAWKQNWPMCPSFHEGAAIYRFSNNSVQLRWQAWKMKLYNTLLSCRPSKSRFLLKSCLRCRVLLHLTPSLCLENAFPFSCRQTAAQVWYMAEKLNPLDLTEDLAGLDFSIYLLKSSGDKPTVQVFMQKAIWIILELHYTLPNPTLPNPVVFVYWNCVLN